MRKAVARTASTFVAAVGVLAVAVVGVLAVATPASAHVSVDPGEASQGGFARVAFRVPTERADASTTQVEVHLPEDAPIGSVSTMPVPGWTVEVTRTTLDEPVEVHGTQLDEVVSVLTWTADGEEAAIGPGEFGEFPVSLGPLPEVDELVFPTLQTYSSGEVVRWIELPDPDGAEPENPAPVLALTAAGGGSGDVGDAAERAADDAEDSSDDTTADGAPAGAEGSRQEEAADDGSGGAASWLGGAGLIAGLAGLAMGGAAFARTRRG